MRRFSVPLETHITRGLLDDIKSDFFSSFKWNKREQGGTSRFYWKGEGTFCPAPRRFEANEELPIVLIKRIIDRLL